MESYIGEIKTFAGNRFIPDGWMLCSGQTIRIVDNEALYSLLGTIYGGDGVNTFGLPDLRGYTPVNVGQGPNLSKYVLGQIAGREQVVITEDELPVHNHTLNVSTADGTIDRLGANYLAAPVDHSTAATPLGMYLPGSAAGIKEVALDTSSISNTGNSQSHDNLMPFMTMNYIICVANGLYPTAG